MALEPTPDPLARAIGAARQETPEGWIEISESIMSRIVGMVRPSEPVLAFAADGAAEHDADGSRTFVSARVIVDVVRRLLQSEPTHAPDGIRLHVDDGRLTGIDLSLVCAYGPDLVALADDVRRRVLAEVRALLGTDPAFTEASVAIDITDVVEGDPNLT